MGCTAAVPIRPALRTAESACSSLHFVFLPGTFEVGFGIVGTPLKYGLTSEIPGITSYSIPYNRSRYYEETLTEGANMTVDHIASQAATCPDQRFILGGFSKGASVMHRVDLPNELKSKVLAINIFGDPDVKSAPSIVNNWPIESPVINNSPRNRTDASQNVISFCNRGDYTCYPGGDDFIPHILYPLDGSILTAVQFDKMRAGM
ncbi:cutinase [Ceratobasidium sp. AG-Ba]|nr:cutinase [Ceratobasidium sp. AG-Ba]